MAPANTPCDGCGKPFPIDLLDGKPSARAMAAYGSLADALWAGADCDRLMCRPCYGHGWTAGPSL